MIRAAAMTVFTAFIASVIPANAHHSNPLYFEMSRAITLEGEIVRVEWINPHVLLYLQSRNDKGEPEIWILHGSSLRNALRAVGAMKDRLAPGIAIAARAWPSRHPLFVNDVQTVLPTRPDDARKSTHIVGAGEIRFANGDIVALGGGPKF